MSACRTRAQFAKLLVSLPIGDLAIAVAIEDDAACRATLSDWARVTMSAHTELSVQSLGITNTNIRTHFLNAHVHARPNATFLGQGPHQDLVEAACSFYEERFRKNTNRSAVLAVLLAYTVEDGLQFWACEQSFPAKVVFVNEHVFFVET